MAEATLKIRALYHRMPGAPEVPANADGTPKWEAVEGNEHWDFCATIVHLIDQGTAASTASAIPASTQREAQT